MFEYSRESQPREGVLTITHDEAQALYDFVGHLSQHAFDRSPDSAPENCLGEIKSRCVVILGD